MGQAFAVHHDENMVFARLDVAQPRQQDRRGPNQDMALFDLPRVIDMRSNVSKEDQPEQFSNDPIEKDVGEQIKTDGAVGRDIAGRFTPCDRGVSAINTMIGPGHATTETRVCNAARKATTAQTAIRNVPMTSTQSNTTIVISRSPNNPGASVTSSRT
jgi:hypothetical protein